MLSKKAKYAINALAYIAKHMDDQPIAVRRISEEQHIPLKFLESILVELKNARILNSRKGKYGGYMLNMAPEKINLLMIMRLIDGPIALLPCASLNFYSGCEECTDEDTCGIRQIGIEIRDENLKRLNRATLTNIIEREAKLLKKL